MKKLILFNRFISFILVLAMMFSTFTVPNGLMIVSAEDLIDDELEDFGGSGPERTGGEPEDIVNLNELGDLPFSTSMLYYLHFSFADDPYTKEEIGGKEYRFLTVENGSDLIVELIIGIDGHHYGNFLYAVYTIDLSAIKDYIQDVGPGIGSSAYTAPHFDRDTGILTLYFGNGIDPVRKGETSATLATPYVITFINGEIPDTANGGPMIYGESFDVEAYFIDNDGKLYRQTTSTLLNEWQNPVQKTFDLKFASPKDEWKIDKPDNQIKVDASPEAKAENKIYVTYEIDASLIDSVTEEGRSATDPGRLFIDEFIVSDKFENIFEEGAGPTLEKVEISGGATLFDKSNAIYNNNVKIGSSPAGVGNLSLAGKTLYILNEYSVLKKSRKFIDSTGFWDSNPEEIPWNIVKDSGDNYIVSYPQNTKYLITVSFPYNEYYESELINPKNPKTLIENTATLEYKLLGRSSLGGSDNAEILIGGVDEKKNGADVAVTKKFVIGEIGEGKKNIEIPLSEVDTSKGIPKFALVRDKNEAWDGNVVIDGKSVPNLAESLDRTDPENPVFKPVMPKPLDTVTIDGKKVISSATITFENVYPGEYYLVEITKNSDFDDVIFTYNSSASGENPDLSKVIITDGTGDRTVSVHVANSPKVNGALIFQKRIDNPTSLSGYVTAKPGIKFTLCPAIYNGGIWEVDTGSAILPVTVATNSTGIVSFTQIPNGDYLLFEDEVTLEERHRDYAIIDPIHVNIEANRLTLLTPFNNKDGKPVVVNTVTEPYNIIYNYGSLGTLEIIKEYYYWTWDNTTSSMVETKRTPAIGIVNPTGTKMDGAKFQLYKPYTPVAGDVENVNYIVRKFEDNTIILAKAIYDGEPIEIQIGFTSGTNPKNSGFEFIPKGDYYVIETYDNKTNLENYRMNETVFMVTVEAGETRSYTHKNYSKKTTIKIIKEDMHGNNLETDLHVDLSAMTFNVYGPDDQTKLLYTGVSKAFIESKANFCEFEVGKTYWIEEKIAPDGYGLAALQKFTIKDGEDKFNGLIENPQIITIKDPLLAKVSLFKYRYDYTQTGNIGVGLGGVEFYLAKANTPLNPDPTKQTWTTVKPDLTTGAGASLGLISAEKLEPGIYRFVEVAPPNNDYSNLAPLNYVQFEVVPNPDKNGDLDIKIGEDIDRNPIFLEDGKTLMMSNAPKAWLTIENWNYDNTNMPLEGAKFAIFSDPECTNQIGAFTYQTNKNGKTEPIPIDVYLISGGLHDINVYIKQISAPTNCFGNGDDVNILTEGGEEVNIKDLYGPKENGVELFKVLQVHLNAGEIKTEKFYNIRKARIEIKKTKQVLNRTTPDPHTNVRFELYVGSVAPENFVDYTITEWPNGDAWLGFHPHNLDPHLTYILVDKGPVEKEYDLKNFEIVYVLSANEKIIFDDFENAKDIVYETNPVNTQAMGRIDITKQSYRSDANGNMLNNQTESAKLDPDKGPNNAGNYATYNELLAVGKEEFFVPYLNDQRNQLNATYRILRTDLLPYDEYKKLPGNSGKTESQWVEYLSTYKDPETGKNMYLVETIATDNIPGQTQRAARSQMLNPGEYIVVEMSTGIGLVMNRPAYTNTNKGASTYSSSPIGQSYVSNAIPKQLPYYKSGSTYYSYSIITVQPEAPYNSEGKIANISKEDFYNGEAKGGGGFGPSSDNLTFLKKDNDGNPLEGAKFEIYLGKIKAESMDKWRTTPEFIGPEDIEIDPAYLTAKGPLAVVTTDENGKGTTNPFAFTYRGAYKDINGVSKSGYYINTDYTQYNRYNGFKTQPNKTNNLIPYGNTGPGGAGVTDPRETDTLFFVIKEIEAPFGYALNTSEYCLRWQILRDVTDVNVEASYKDYVLIDEMVYFVDNDESKIVVNGKDYAVVSDGKGGRQVVIKEGTIKDGKVEIEPVIYPVAEKGGYVTVGGVNYAILDETVDSKPRRSVYISNRYHEVTGEIGKSERISVLYGLFYPTWEIPVITDAKDFATIEINKFDGSIWNGTEDGEAYRLNEATFQLWIKAPGSEPVLYMNGDAPVTVTTKTGESKIKGRAAFTDVPYFGEGTLYYVEEIKAPDGFEINRDDTYDSYPGNNSVLVDVTINHWESLGPGFRLYTINIKNWPKVQPSIKKYDDKGQPLGGATFKFYYIGSTSVPAQSGTYPQPTELERYLARVESARVRNPAHDLSLFTKRLYTGPLTAAERLTVSAMIVGTVANPLFTQAVKDAALQTSATLTATEKAILQKYIDDYLNANSNGIILLETGLVSNASGEVTVKGKYGGSCGEGRYLFVEDPWPETSQYYIPEFKFNSIYGSNSVNNPTRHDVPVRIVNGVFKTDEGLGNGVNGAMNGKIINNTKANLTVKKYYITNSGDSTALLGNAEFEVYKSRGDAINKSTPIISNAKTGAAGVDLGILVLRLELGKYWIVETAAPANFKIGPGAIKCIEIRPRKEGDPGTGPVVIDNCDEYGNFVSVNTNNLLEFYNFTDQGGLIVRKVDTISGIAIKGGAGGSPATFRIYDSENKPVMIGGKTDITTDVNGEAKFPGLKPGIYKVVEVSPPSGYSKNADIAPYPVDNYTISEQGVLSHTVSESGVITYKRVPTTAKVYKDGGDFYVEVKESETAGIIFKNPKLGSLTVRKYASTATDPIPMSGVFFKIYRVIENTSGKYEIDLSWDTTGRSTKTGLDGKITFSNLEPGKYMIFEAPVNGYVIPFGYANITDANAAIAANPALISKFVITIEDELSTVGDRFNAQRDIINIPDKGIIEIHNFDVNDKTKPLGGSTFIIEKWTGTGCIYVGGAPYKVVDGIINAPGIPALDGQLITGGKIQVNGKEYIVGADNKVTVDGVVYNVVNGKVDVGGILCPVLEGKITAGGKEYIVVDGYIYYGADIVPIVNGQAVYGDDTYTAKDGKIKIGTTEYMIAGMEWAPAKDSTNTNDIVLTTAIVMDGTKQVDAVGVTELPTGTYRILQTGVQPGAGPSSYYSMDQTILLHYSNANVGEVWDNVNKVNTIIFTVAVGDIRSFTMYNELSKVPALNPTKTTKNGSKIDGITGNPQFEGLPTTTKEVEDPNFKTGSYGSLINDERTVDFWIKNIYDGGNNRQLLNFTVEDSTLRYILFDKSALTNTADYYYYEKLVIGKAAQDNGLDIYAGVIVQTKTGWESMPRFAGNIKNAALVVDFKTANMKDVIGFRVVYSNVEIEPGRPLPSLRVGAGFKADDIKTTILLKQWQTVISGKYQGEVEEIINKVNITSNYIDRQQVTRMSHANREAKYTASKNTPPQPVISVKKTAATKLGEYEDPAAKYQPGDVVRYKIEVKNHSAPGSNLWFEGIIIADKLPDDMIYDPNSVQIREIPPSPVPTTPEYLGRVLPPASVVPYETNGKYYIWVLPSDYKLVPGGTLILEFEVKLTDHALQGGRDNLCFVTSQKFIDKTEANPDGRSWKEEGGAGNGTLSGSEDSDSGILNKALNTYGINGIYSFTNNKWLYTSKEINVSLASIATTYKLQAGDLDAAFPIPGEFLPDWKTPASLSFGGKIKYQIGFANMSDRISSFMNTRLVDMFPVENDISSAGKERRTDYPNDFGLYLTEISNVPDGAIIYGTTKTIGHIYQEDQGKYNPALLTENRYLCDFEGTKSYSDLSSPDWIKLTSMPGMFVDYFVNEVFNVKNNKVTFDSTEYSITTGSPPTVKIDKSKYSNGTYDIINYNSTTKEGKVILPVKYWKCTNTDVLKNFKGIGVDLKDCGDTAVVPGVGTVHVLPSGKGVSIDYMMSLPIPEEDNMPDLSDLPAKYEKNYNGWLAYLTDRQFVNAVVGAGQATTGTKTIESNPVTAKVTGMTKNISGYVWHDADFNGIMDIGETRIANAVVSIKQFKDGVQVMTFARETYTDANGYYEFTGLPATLSESLGIYSYEITIYRQYANGTTIPYKDFTIQDGYFANEDHTVIDVVPATDITVGTSKVPQTFNGEIKNSTKRIVLRSEDIKNINAGLLNFYKLQIGKVVSGYREDGEEFEIEIYKKDPKAPAPYLGKLVKSITFTTPIASADSIKEILLQEGAYIIVEKGVESVVSLYDLTVAVNNVTILNGTNPKIFDSKVYEFNLNSDQFVNLTNTRKVGSISIKKELEDVTLPNGEKVKFAETSSTFEFVIAQKGVSGYYDTYIIVAADSPGIYRNTGVTTNNKEEAIIRITLDKTNSTKTITVNGLEYKDYRIEELANDKYNIFSVTVDGTENAEGDEYAEILLNKSLIPINFKNIIKTGSIELSKNFINAFGQWEDNGNGFVVELYKKDPASDNYVKIKNVTIKADGTIEKIDNLPYGDYKFVEKREKNAVGTVLEGEIDLMYAYNIKYRVWNGLYEVYIDENSYIVDMDIRKVYRDMGNGVKGAELEDAYLIIDEAEPVTTIKIGDVEIGAITYPIKQRFVEFTPEANTTAKITLASPDQSYQITNIEKDTGRLIIEKFVYRNGGSIKSPLTDFALNKPFIYEIRIDSKTTKPKLDINGNKVYESGLLVEIPAVSRTIYLVPGETFELTELSPDDYTITEVAYYYNYANNYSAVRSVSDKTTKPSGIDMVRVPFENKENPAYTYSVVTGAAPLPGDAIKVELLMPVDAADKVTVKNVEKKAKLIINKTGVGNFENVEFKLVIPGTNTIVHESSVDSENKVVFNNIEYGSYTLREYITAEKDRGYEPDPIKIDGITYKWTFVKVGAGPSPVGSYYELSPAIKFSPADVPEQKIVDETWAESIIIKTLGVENTKLLGRIEFTKIWQNVNRDNMAAPGSENWPMFKVELTTDSNKTYFFDGVGLGGTNGVKFTTSYIPQGSYILYEYIKATDASIPDLTKWTKMASSDITGYIKYVFGTEIDLNGSHAIVVTLSGIDSQTLFNVIKEPVINQPYGSLRIAKAPLLGNYEDWDIINTEDEVFTAKIKVGEDEFGENEYMTFTGAGPDYVYDGTSSTGSEITFGINNPATISNIPAGMICVVEETANPLKYTTTYDPEDGIADAIIYGRTNTVEVTNTYIPGKGILEITKEIDGATDEWDGASDEEFTVQVRLAGGSYMKLIPTGINEYKYDENNLETSIIMFTIKAGADKTVRITDIPSSTVCMVEEIILGYDVFKYSVKYTYGVDTSSNPISVTVPNSPTPVEVGITNTFKERGLGGLIIRKDFDVNDALSWGVDGNTEFKAKVKETITGRWFTFIENDEYDEDYDGYYQYVCTGTTQNEEDAGIAVFSKFSPAIIFKIPGNAICIVKEIIPDGAKYADTEYRYPLEGEEQITIVRESNDPVTVVNTFDEVGRLEIKKELAGRHDIDWDVTAITEFTVRIEVGADSGKYMTVEKIDGKYFYKGSDGTNYNTFEFSVNSPVTIYGIPVGTVCTVEEIGEVTPSGGNFDVSYSNLLPIVKNNNTITVTNTYETGKGALEIKKLLAGNVGDWVNAVDQNAKSFEVAVKIVDESNTTLGYMTFNTSNVYTGTTLNKTDAKFTVSQSQPVIIKGIPAGTICVVEEIVPADAPYVATYSLSKVEIVNKAIYNITHEVTITNTYKEGKGKLTINKELTGRPQDWGAGNTTEFKAKIKVVDGEYLTVTGTAPNYTYSGTSAAGSEITFSKNVPAVITGIPVRLANCEVIEIIGSAHYGLAGCEYDNGAGNDNTNAIIKENGEAIVTLTNHYETGEGKLKIEKKLAGAYSDWIDEEDEDTELFEVVVEVYELGISKGYMTFNPTTKVYTGTTPTKTDAIFTISRSQPMIITGIPAGTVCVVKEIVPTGAPYIDSYSNYSILDGTEPVAGDTVEMINDVIHVMTITNTYSNGEGSLTIKKALTGRYKEDWNVDETKEFTAIIEVIGTIPEYLIFDSEGIFKGTTTDIKKASEAIFSVKAPMTITKIPVRIENCKVIETSKGDNYNFVDDGKNNAVIKEKSEAVVTLTNYYKTGAGNLEIKKALTGDYINWVTVAEPFEVVVKVIDDLGAIIGYMTFNPTTKAYISTTPTQTAANIFTISQSQSVIITGIPAGTICVVEEIVPTGTPPYSASYSVSKVTIGNTITGLVTIENYFKQSYGELTIVKEYGTDYDGWDDDTLFTAKIKVGEDEFGENEYMTFTGGGPEYTYSGKNGTGSEITFSKNAPATIIKIPAGMECEVIEIIPEDADYTEKYSANNGNAILNSDLYEDANIVTVTNTPKGRLIINKVLAGSYSSYAKTSTEFTAKIKVGSKYMIVDVDEDGPDYTYIYSGTDSIGSEIVFSMDNPAVITGIPADMPCEVIENVPKGAAEKYSANNGDKIPGGGDLEITVTNTYTTTTTITIPDPDPTTDPPTDPDTSKETGTTAESSTTTTTEPEKATENETTAEPGTTTETSTEPVIDDGTEDGTTTESSTEPTIDEPTSDEKTTTEKPTEPTIDEPESSANTTESVTDPITTTSRTTTVSTEFVTLPEGIELLDEDEVDIEWLEIHSTPLANGWFAVSLGDDWWEIFDENGRPLGIFRAPNGGDINDYDLEFILNNLIPTARILPQTTPKGKTNPITGDKIIGIIIMLMGLTGTIICLLHKKRSKKLILKQ